tara:strand:- start:317 stop:652 length:336 start_codon:yes stop_codon:yes gene_type:complete
VIIGEFVGRGEPGKDRLIGRVGVDHQIIGVHLARAHSEFGVMFWMFGIAAGASEARHHDAEQRRGRVVAIQRPRAIDDDIVRRVCGGHGVKTPFDGPVFIFSYWWSIKYAV